MKTRFSGTEIFRKYLWYLLRERSFDVDAVADMQQLKSSLGLADPEVQIAEPFAPANMHLGFD